MVTSKLMKLSWTLAIGAMAVFVSGSVAHAQQTTTPEQPSETSAAKSGHSGMVPDRVFVRKAAEGGLAEVKLGQLAEEKGQSETVKDFGKRMVQDHSKANDELKSAASQDNITVPDNLSPKDQATYDKLSKLSGAEFDKAYARDMVKDHQQDIAEFKREANDGKDQNVKNFASETVPTLEEHLKLAHHMLQTVQGGSASGGGSQ